MTGGIAAAGASLSSPSPSPEGFVGVLDSGVGGISVLRHLVGEMPGEDFVYYGDSANAPYGERPPAEVHALASAAARMLVGMGAKALVIACNTATSTSCAALRAEYPSIPIVGVEPAIKPACEACPGGRVLVMATPATIAGDRYRRLAEAHAGEAEIVPAPCPGLAARIEEGRLGDPDLRALLDGLIGRHAGRVDAAVLGCTHYPFVAGAISEALGGNVGLFDGGEGAARQAKRLLAARGLLRGGGGGKESGAGGAAGSGGSVTFLSSKPGEAEIRLYRSFFEQGTA